MMEPPECLIMKFGSCVFDDRLDLEVSKLEFSILGFGSQVLELGLDPDVWTWIFGSLGFRPGGIVDSLVTTV